MSDTETLTEQTITTSDLAQDIPPEQVALDHEDPSLPSLCGNCGEPLLGPHCYACGQPAKSLVRQFPELIGDFFGAVFGLDSRIARTFGPLLCKPGFLTSEYLAGRRVRYVSPVRLFVFLCLTAFFAAQLSSDWRVGDGVNNSRETVVGINVTAVESSITRAGSVEEVLLLRNEALEEIAEVSRESAEVPGFGGILGGVAQVVRAHAQRRIAELDPSAELAEAEASGPSQELEPLRFDGAPAVVNAWLARQSAKFISNLARIAHDPNLLKDALFGAIPSTLFVMLPVFALMLSLLYLFKRRLYMEHLIVALHSHAFLSLVLLLLVALSDLRAWLTGPGTFAESLFSMALWALVVWMPVYLLLMQKRVYRQGWLATSLKFALLGSAYIALIGAATAFAILTSMVNL